MAPEIEVSDLVEVQMENGGAAPQFLPADAEDCSKTWRFPNDFPFDKPELQRGITLLTSYSGIPREQVEAHARNMRDKAFSVFPYPCIGRWRFLHMYLADTPEYATILSRVKAGGVFIDIGCCFGQILRQLAFDGAPAENLVGVDLQPAFVDLGYELFRDRDTFGAKFLTGDVLAPVEPGSSEDKFSDLQGKAEVIHAASVFHLFGWADQVRLGVRVAGFFKPEGDVLLLGRQVGNREPLPREEHERQGLGSYRHNEKTLQALWDEIGAATGTRWEVQTHMIQRKDEPDRNDDVWISMVIIHYAVRRVGK